MSDREDYGGGRSMGQIDFKKPKFKVKCETLGPDVIANFRVRPEVHGMVKSLADQAGVGMADVVRQMIDFALEHS